MAKTNNQKSKLLEILSEIPFIDHACKKVGISRMTFYRWRKDDLDFREKTDHAIALGLNKFAEHAESKLAKKVDEGYFPSIKFFLEHNHPRYKPGYLCTEEDPEFKEKNRWALKYLLRRYELKSPPIAEVVHKLLREGTPEIRREFLNSLEDENEFPRPR